MDIRFQNASGGEWRADAVIVACFEGQTPESHAPALWEAAPWLSISPGLRDFTGKKGEQLMLYGHPSMALSRVLLLGLGAAQDCKVATLRKAIAKAMQTCREAGFETVAFCAQNAASIATTIGACTQEVIAKEVTTSALLGLYRCDEYRSDLSDVKKNPRWFGFLFTEKETPDAGHRAIRQGEAEAHGVMFARNLSNGPANYITPTVVAESALSLAKKYMFSCTVLNAEQIQEIGMGAFWAVARGSRQEPRFIVLEHCPKGKEKDAPVVLVGKGITFDTGGISLKPGLNMHEMKGDMGGAAAVLGFFNALGQMPDAEDMPRTIGIIPTAENMPDGDATRPGDVVTTLSGKTVEILNTDAEGRLILCDALTYAQREYAPKVIIDIATLTGACVVALGDNATGLFTKDKQLRSVILDAADATGDLCWPLPLWDEYDQNLKSNVADMPNIGPREGGALHAALFLQRFIEKETRWAHLDIAGPGYVVKTSELHPVSGATGVGVRMFCEMVRSFK